MVFRQGKNMEKDYLRPVKDALSLIHTPALALTEDSLVIAHNEASKKLIHPTGQLDGKYLTGFLTGKNQRKSFLRKLHELSSFEASQEMDLILEGEGDDIPVSAMIRHSRAGCLDFFMVGLKAYKQDPLDRSVNRTAESQVPEYSQIIEGAADLILTLSTDGSLRWCSNACSRLLGYSRDHLMGRPLDQFVHKADLSSVNQLISDAFNREVVPPAIFRMLRRYGGHGWFEATAAPFRGSMTSGEKEIVCVIRDITHRRQSEESLLRTERLKAVGEMASGVAHNFNNLLQIVTGGTQLSLTDLELGDYEQVKSNLKRILDSARLGSETVRRLQQFARPHTDPSMVEGAVFDLSETVKQAVFMTEPYWRSGPQEKSVHVDLFTDLTPGSMVEGKENEVFEVVVNLIRNAVEALPNGGTIEVGVKPRGSEVIMTVRDNGVGIPENSIDRVFEPFWTTKGSKGTGIGLASSFGIVTQHGGRIIVDSKPGQGALFDVRLPYSSKNPASVGESNTVMTTTQNNLLIVDDMELVVRTLEHGLGRYFKEIYTALNGGEALDIFRKNRIDAIICDLGMPEIDGWEVAETVRNISRESGAQKPPFILLTGLGGQLDRSRDMTARGVDRILEKPADVALLLETITELTGD